MEHRAHLRPGHVGHATPAGSIAAPMPLTWCSTAPNSQHSGGGTHSCSWQPEETYGLSTNKAQSAWQHSSASATMHATRHCPAGGIVDLARWHANKTTRPYQCCSGETRMVPSACGSPAQSSLSACVALVRTQTSPAWASQ